MSRERPILMSAPMVRALLDGRKTQTRRAVKLKGAEDIEEWTVNPKRLWPWSPDGNDWLACPYGEVGDRLWVKETFAYDGSKNPEALYRATWECKRDFPGVICEHGPARWKLSIFMPRWASRITLEVTGVRVERLQAITQADARAEGVVDTSSVWDILEPPLNDTDRCGPRGAYEALWESINGAGSWDANPWVWVVEFKKLEPT